MPTYSTYVTTVGVQTRCAGQTHNHAVLALGDDALFALVRFSVLDDSIFSPLDSLDHPLRL